MNYIYDICKELDIHCPIKTTWYCDYGFLGLVWYCQIEHIESNINIQTFHENKNEAERNAQELYEELFNVYYKEKISYLSSRIDLTLKYIQSSEKLLTKFLVKLVTRDKIPDTTLKSLYQPYQNILKERKVFIQNISKIPFENKIINNNNESFNIESNEISSFT